MTKNAFCYIIYIIMSLIFYICGDLPLCNTGKGTEMFEYKKLPLAKGAYIDCVKCDKFRFSLICITLLLGRLTLPEKKALYVLCTMMARSCARCPSPSEFDVATGMLYNAMISFGFSEESGGEVLMTASADYVGGALFGEPHME